MTNSYYCTSSLNDFRTYYKLSSTKDQDINLTLWGSSHDSDKSRPQHDVPMRKHLIIYS